MLIGYARVSKADGSQTTNLQRDALLAAGVDPDQIYEDQASGKQLLGCYGLMGASSKRRVAVKSPSDPWWIAANRAPNAP